MKILGLSTFCDSSAAIVIDGEIVAAVEEERLNRIKHYEGVPWMSINECLYLSGLSLKDIDIITFGWNPLIGWYTRIVESLKAALINPEFLKVKYKRGGNYLDGCKNILNFRNNVLFDC